MRGHHRRHLDKGYSLVEVLVAISLFVLLTGLVYGLIVRTQQVTRTTAASTMSQSQLIDGVNRVVRDVATSDSIETATAEQLVMNVKTSTNCRRVEFAVSGVNLTSKEVVQATCPTTLGTAATKTIIDKMNWNSGDTLFTYYDRQGNALAAPVSDTSTIARVGISVSVKIKDRANPLRLSASASPRTVATPEGTTSDIVVAPSPVTFPDGGNAGTCASTYRATWNPALGVTAYTVFVNGTQVAYISDPNVTYYDLTGMTAGSSYTVEVYSSGDGGTTPAPGQQVVTRCPSAPVITGSRIAAGGDGIANDNQIRWPNVPGATGYTIYRDGVPVGNAAQSGTGTVNWLDADRPWGSTSSYYVTATNPGGESTSSNTVTLSQLPAPPVLTGSEFDGYNTLSWNAVPTATAYDVWRSGVKIATVTTPSYRDNTPGWGSTQNYAVFAINSVGASRSSNVVTLLQPPGPFSITNGDGRGWRKYTDENGAIVNNTDDSLWLDWSVSSNAARYVAKHDKASVNSYDGPSTRFPTSGWVNATSGTTYEFTITAYAANGKSRVAATKTLTVPPAPPRYLWAGTYCNINANDNGWKHGMKWTNAPYTGTANYTLLDEWQFRLKDRTNYDAGFIFNNLVRSNNYPISSTQATTLFGGNSSSGSNIIPNTAGYGGAYYATNYVNTAGDFGGNASATLGTSGHKEGPDPVACPAGNTSWAWNKQAGPVKERNPFS